MSLMYKGRILLVDDLPDVQKTLAGLLSDENYDVRVASSSAEALQLLEAELFHVAILDVRLDETDEDNREGIQLMHQIKQKDPSVTIIILTGYADVRMVQEALQPDGNGARPAFGFLQKTEIRQLVAEVKKAFEHAVHINTALDIQNAEYLSLMLSKKLRFVSGPKPSPKQLTEEANDILRKLFFGCERITLQPVQRGYSGVVVLKVIPWYQGEGQGEALIAKIGEHFLVDWTFGRAG